jgi:hypothetical protein
LANPRTVHGLLTKVREFYKTHNWTQGTLYDHDNSFCVLGAAAAVLTNESRIIEFGPNTLSHWSDIEYADPETDEKLPPVKGAELLRRLEDWVIDYYDDDIVTINDDADSQHEFMLWLRDAEQLAKKQKV